MGGARPVSRRSSLKRLFPFPIAAFLGFWKRENRPAQKFMDVFWKTAPAYLFARYVAFGKRPPAGEVEFQRELIFSTRLPSLAPCWSARRR
ncbi:MAG: hypothetical protein PHP28_12655 [Actinomycetota bacterium]|nr:hypothetical protein [Actinomycetota bacterium]MDD5667442.1 hypothetical protein [Actinomycetota bacterium]